MCGTPREGSREGTCCRANSANPRAGGRGSCRLCARPARGESGLIVPAGRCRSPAVRPPSGRPCSRQEEGREKCRPWARCGSPCPVPRTRFTAPRSHPASDAPVASAHITTGRPRAASVPRTPSAGPPVAPLPQTAVQLPSLTAAGPQTLPRLLRVHPRAGSSSGTRGSGARRPRRWPGLDRGSGPEPGAWGVRPFILCYSSVHLADVQGARPACG